MTSQAPARKQTPHALQPPAKLSKKKSDACDSRPWPAQGPHGLHKHGWTRNHTWEAQNIAQASQLLCLLAHSWHSSRMLNPCAPQSTCLLSVSIHRRLENLHQHHAPQALLAEATTSRQAVLQARRQAVLTASSDTASATTGSATSCAPGAATSCAPSAATSCAHSLFRYSLGDDRLGDKLCSKRGDKLCSRRGDKLCSRRGDKLCSQPLQIQPRRRPARRQAVLQARRPQTRRPQPLQTQPQRRQARRQAVLQERRRQPAILHQDLGQRNMNSRSYKSLSQHPHEGLRDLGQFPAYRKLCRGHTQGRLCEPHYQFAG